MLLCESKSASADIPLRSRRSTDMSSRDACDTGFTLKLGLKISSAGVRQRQRLDTRLLHTLRPPPPQLFTILTMASKHTSRALRSSVKQLAAPIVQRRTFIATSNAVRAGAAAASRATATIPFQQTRGIKTIDFAGTKETVFGELLRLSLGSIPLLTIVS